MFSSDQWKLIPLAIFSSPQPVNVLAVRRMIEGDNIRSVGVGKGGSAPPLPKKQVISQT
jgi:hypothetical protein